MMEAIPLTFVLEELSTKNWFGTVFRKRAPEYLILIIKNLLMKTTLGIVGGIVLSLLTASVHAQVTPTTPTTTPTTTTTTTWDASKNPTVDSINAKYRDKIVAAPVALTTEQIFPVIGKYESSTNPEALIITITLDEQNKGIAWIDGLPQGRVKAMLRKSPAVYKIPAQKTEEGKDVKEGTLIYDKEMNTLSIVLGKEFNAENPAAVFTEPAPVEEEAVVKTKSKSKKAKKVEEKPWIYTATKLEKTTAMN
jgi:hypothetical protein